MGELLRLIARQAGQVIKARLRDVLRDVAFRAVWLMLAAAAALFALLFGSIAAYLYLATLMAPWFAALCLAGGWFALTALGLFVATRRRRAAAGGTAPGMTQEMAGDATRLGLAEARAQGEALARRVEPEHLVVLGLIAGLTAGRRVSRPAADD